MQQFPADGNGPSAGGATRDARQAGQPIRPGLVPTMVLYALLFLAVLGGIGVLAAHSLSSIAELSIDTRDEVLPTVFDRQRTALNLERMGRFGEAVYLSRDPRRRQTLRLAARVLSQDTAFEASQSVREAVSRAYAAIDRIAELRGQQEGWEAGLRQRLGVLDSLLAEAGQAGDQAGREDIDILRAMRLVLEKARFAPTLTDLLQARNEVYQLSGRLSTERLRQRAHDLGEALTLRKDTILADSECRVLWEEANELIEAQTQKITSKAAVIAAARFTTIAEEAREAMRVGSLGIAAAGLALLVLIAFMRRDILMPILHSARGLEDIGRGLYSLKLPRPRIRELEKIVQAVESQAGFVGQIAERTEELEREIAERRKTERELALAKEAAEAADRAKSDFLASMSHEIRTPMNAILGMTDMLAETPLSPDQETYLDVTRASGEHLLEIISDILDLSKVEAGKLTLENVAFDLRELVDRIMEPIGIRARSKHLAVECVVDEAVPRHFTGDPMRLRQVLANLLGNAVKFTAVGRVALTVEPAKAHWPPGTLHFVVSDTGIGIPSAALRLVFEPFTQADSSTTRKFGGTGLGLAICKRLAELMGGGVRVESHPGQGSTFHFFVPPGQAQAAGPEPEARPAPRPAPQEQVRPLRILLAEDSEANRLLLQLIFKATPHRLDFACDGAEALEMFARERYDLIIMDIQMPVMDGYEATRGIRALERAQGRAPVPILALTANAFAEDRERCLAAGCTQYLAKPVRKDDLLRLAGSLTAREEDQAGPSAGTGCAADGV